MIRPCRPVKLFESCPEIFALNFGNKNAGGGEDASQILLGLVIDSTSSIFIAERLPNTETTAVCFIVAVDFFLLLQMATKLLDCTI